MKTKLLAILAASAFAVTFTACSDDDDNTTPDNGGKELTELNGNITEDVTLSGTSVNLTGATIVRSGATLTIPAGTTIKAGQGTEMYLLVERGAKIIAEGTADKPIVFTSAASSPKAGDWGGLIINGYAPLTADGEEGKTEINTAILYGGDKADDNSGVLNYVRLEYTGAKIDAESEHNGLTLNGVGNGTQINNIFIREGADDAIEFFGGSVNVTNLLVVNSQDDMFDFTQGYTGTLKNSYGIWETTYESSSEDPRGIEADGNLDGKLATNPNQSNFKVEDMTIVNKATKSEMKDVVKIRRGAKAAISNLKIDIASSSTFGDIIDFTDDKGTGSATIAYTLLPATLTTKVNPTDAAGLTKDDKQTGATTSVFSWTGYSF